MDGDGERKARPCTPVTAKAAKKSDNPRTRVISVGLYQSSTGTLWYGKDRPITRKESKEANKKSCESVGRPKKKIGREKPIFSTSTTASQLRDKRGAALSSIYATRNATSSPFRRAVSSLLPRAIIMQTWRPTLSKRCTNIEVQQASHTTTILLNNDNKNVFESTKTATIPY